MILGLGGSYMYFSNNQAESETYVTMEPFQNPESFDQQPPESFVMAGYGSYDEGIPKEI